MLGVFANRISGEENAYQNMKVLLHDDIIKASSQDFSGLEKYNYTIYNLDGVVTYSNDSTFEIGKKVDLSILNGHDQGKSSDTMMTYVTPYVVNEVQQGMLYVSVPKGLVEHQNKSKVYYIGALAVFLVLLIVEWQTARIVRRDVIHPIKELHKVTNSIQSGILDEPLRYDYDGEIGTLCHDFEALRSELQFSKENEKKLKEKEKLLLAYISHDLKTPLATISGYVEGIHNDIITGDHLHEYTGIILQKIQMLNALINDILEHSKSQLNKFTIQKEEVYARPFFTDILMETEAECKKNSRVFTYNEVPDVLLTIDTKRIKQVMQNLFGNAMKFTKSGDQIIVTFTLQEEKICVSVKDTGMGIEAMALPFVFQEFYRGEKARTLNVAGSGLGLSISKFIVEHHGGQIDCDSILGEWTEVMFTLPL
jgi:signal transduction histidine kinase